MPKTSKTIKLIAIWSIVSGSAFAVLGNIYASHRIQQLKALSARSHDKYTLGTKYIPNINSLEVNQYGDLCSHAGFTSGKECPFWDGSRRHTFQSDQFGFKTTGQFSQSDIVIIGDSFLGAIGGEDTSDQLGATLAKLTNRRIYEAAHPGDIDFYINRHKLLTKAQKKPKKYIFMLFEGNDFYETERLKRQSPSKQRIWHQLRPIYGPIGNFIKNTSLYKIIKTAHAAKQDSQSNIITRTINGRIQAFSSGYAKISATDLTMRPSHFKYIKNNSDSVCAIFIIPTASSVYLNKASFKERHPTLDNQLNRLKKAGINFINLTEPLKAAAIKSHRKRNLWWSDDTH